MISRILLGVGLLLVAGALALYHYSPEMRQPASSSSVNQDAGAAADVPPPSADLRGKPAADFALQDMNGKTVRRSDFLGKVLLVNFWATWCGPCQIEIPWFIHFQQKYGPQGLQVVAISLDDEGWKVVKPFAQKFGMDPLTVLLGQQNTPDAFGGLIGLPTTFLIDRQGRYFAKHQGLVSKEDVEDEIVQLLGSSTSPQAGAPQASAPKVNAVKGTPVAAASRAAKS